MFWPPLFKAPQCGAGRCLTTRAYTKKAICIKCTFTLCWVQQDAWNVGKQERAFPSDGSSFHSHMRSSPASVYIICSCMYLSERRSAQRAFNQQLLNKYGAYETRWIIQGGSAHNAKHTLSRFSSQTARTVGLRWKQQVARTRVSCELLSFFPFFSFSRLWQGCHGDAIRGPHKQSKWEWAGGDTLLYLETPSLILLFYSGWIRRAVIKCCWCPYYMTVPPQTFTVFASEEAATSSCVFVCFLSPCRKQMNQVIYLFIFTGKRKKRLLN